MSVDTEVIAYGVLDVYVLRITLLWHGLIPIQCGQDRLHLPPPRRSLARRGRHLHSPRLVRRAPQGRRRRWDGCVRRHPLGRLSVSVRQPVTFTAYPPIPIKSTTPFSFSLYPEGRRSPVI